MYYKFIKNVLNVLKIYKSVLKCIKINLMY